jgi:hypothetical protein
VPEGLLCRVYTAVQGVVVENFPLRADDNLWATLEVDEGSIDVLLRRSWARRLTERFRPCWPLLRSVRSPTW